jgi:hypothetical protein
LWDTALAALPETKEVVEGKVHPGHLRKTYVYATGLGFEALAETISAAVTAFPDNWQGVLSEGLPRVKWAMAEPQWEGVALFAGRVAIARAARRRTAALVKYLLGLPVDDSHLEDLKEVYTILERKLPSPVLIPSAV